ncbi:hydantoinase/oxoprolinase family protein [Pseudonocardia xinjiangensis]|uniref:Hydantoinase/oxoprolinase family protein n=1 Tax=Pseudonocardia xinjiangensis TaxID=75289 RepID=A0ABX1R813_9PSEU|nr:hydantoinase/oxoprolinase family protein [Pseudonocardia xinjiangensis]NMH75794.1 hydantoinase/oxoprolinase family protein [Pseudonocardia xinjiangensis]
MASDERWWMGIDIGGTFTDLVAVNRKTGEIRDLKVLTTRPRQEEGVLEAVRGSGIPIDQIDEIVHGHTTGINAVLSRQGAKTALLATAGHRDLLDLGRMDREFGPRLYDPTWLRPHQEHPIVRRRDRYGVRERIGSDGAEIIALDEDQVRTIAREVRDRGIGSVAVCFMNSYLDQAHEIRAAELLREEYPDVYVQTSALYPVTKEHERTTTVVFDAYVGPTVTGYLHRLEEELAGIGFGGALWVMTMNGGVGSVPETSKAPVFQLVSGPVGGVAGAVQLARTLDGDGTGGNGNFLTMDVGGTSTDVAAVRRGQTPLTDLWTVEHGLVMTMPAVDVRSVGSGAGSLIHLDSLSTLRVGPESAGSQPGPACYGRGGARPTITDACVHLGILQPDLFAGGAIRLDPTLAESALEAVADQLGMTPTELADGAYRLACSNMAGALRSISTFRGLDLREFSLLAFGAAGPMMAVQVARGLGIGSVIVPGHPGEFSAYGLVASDLRVTRAQSPLAPLLAIGPDELEAGFVALEDAATADLVHQGVAESRIGVSREIFAMYAGQTWDNRIALEPGLIDDARLNGIAAQVHEFYLSRYGFTAEEIPIMLTTIEVTAAASRPILPSWRPTAGAGDSLIRRTSMRLAGEEYPDAGVYDRDKLGADEVVNGPAIIVESYATTAIDDGSTACLDGSGNLTVALTTPAGGAR